MTTLIPFRTALVSTLVGLTVNLFFSFSSAANWPQWRGQLMNGVAPDSNPPVSWSETNNVKWKVKVPGKGTSTPIIWGDQIFLQTAIATGKKVETPAAAEPAPAATAPAEGQRRGRGGFGGG